MSKLSALQVKNAKPKEKVYKLRNGYGMHLPVSPTGTKSWLYRFEIDSKEYLIILGSYPKMSLEQVRKARADAREKVKEGRNPGQERKAKK